MDASIVFEDARLLAINKPAGVASHGGSGIAFGAIETLRVLRPRESLELVHRLDRDTSGLLLVARKRSALTELQALMREDGGRAGGIRKRYLALLAGRMPDGVMSVDAPLHVGLRQGGNGMCRSARQASPRSAISRCSSVVAATRTAKCGSRPDARTRSACMRATSAIRWPATTNTATRRSTGACATRWTQAHVPACLDAGIRAQ